MANINSVNVAGRLVRDAEIKYTKEGMAICNFSIAVNDFVKKENVVYFFEVSCFSHTAEYVEKHSKKGCLVFVSGKLIQERWQDKSGNNQSRLKIIAENIQISNTNQGIDEKKQDLNSVEHSGDFFPEDIPF